MRRIELSNEFIEKAKNNPPKWGPLGWITYKRTYARWLEDTQRYEEFYETIKRVVEGNINLDPRLKKEKVSIVELVELQKEAQDLFNTFYSLQALPPGRGLWISGTDYAEQHGDALNNCWFISVRPQPYGKSEIVPFYAAHNEELVSMPFSFLFDQSMKGGGVGFSVAQENIKRIPKVEKAVDIRILCDESNGDFEKFTLDEPNNLAVTYKVPDSREGWVEAFAMMVDAHFKSDMPEVINIDISDIRAEGARIKGFGGIASGAAPLIDLLRIVNELLNERVGGFLTSVDATDLMNLIGKTVVSGNVRRTAEIALGDAEDTDFLVMKQDKEKLMSHRWASNNTVLIRKDFDNYDPIAEAIGVNGEPGMANLYLARNYGRIIDGFNTSADQDVEGWNPCGEITLENGENCNLVEVFPRIISREGGDIRKILKLVARYAKRVTFCDYDWEVTRNVVEKNRRIGVSLSGLQDWILENYGAAVIGWDNGKPIYNKELAQELDDLYNSVKAADIEYSDLLECRQSIKITTVKPSGTVSLLAGVSPGIHWNYAPYYIRRIRFPKNDQLLELLKQGNYQMEPDVYSETATVVEFYVKAPGAECENFKSAGTVSIEEQIATQAFIQTYWADNSVSCTITFKEEEKEKIAALLKQYKGIIKSTSMLPYTNHGFEQMPYDPIEKYEFEGLSKTILARPEEIEGKLEKGELVEIGGCAGGACPVR